VLDPAGLIQQTKVLSPAAQQYIETVWFADHMTSSLPNEVRGHKWKARDLHSRSEGFPSDDVISTIWLAGAAGNYADMENLRMVPACLPQAREDFLEYVKPYVEAFPEHWGYSVPGLLKARGDQADWLAINHRGCGAPMRSGVLASLGETNIPKGAMLVAVSHLHPDALAGAFAIWHAGMAAIEGGNWGDIEAAAFDGAEEGDFMAHQLHDIMRLPKMPPSQLAEQMIETLRREDPYELVTEPRDYFSSRYVTSTSLLVAKKKFRDRDPIMEAIKMAAKLGGDPDTVAVISCGLLQQHDPGAARECLDRAYQDLHTEAFTGMPQ